MNPNYETVVNSSGDELTVDPGTARKLVESGQYKRKGEKGDKENKQETESKSKSSK